MPATATTGHHRSPTPADRLGELLPSAFGLAVFRPFQEAACRAVTAGRDVLLVMPTGAGKSLCYQLPGLARAGTTLVISPLIALMEDQVAKLRELDLAAERIHSGRDRLESRLVCRDYLAGRLDFLFIAPERLAVPGFPEMLAKRKPVLIAVDEAHCISEWGHDFRPDYRLLGARLPQLKPAPIIALTATATPRVQDDIAQQLAIAGAERFIHGFRRTNIAVEVAEMKPSARAAVVSRLLADPGRRPAIVYAPTRKESEALAERLAGGPSPGLPAAPYHAGMAAAARDRTQAAFLAGELEVIVATIAFGMGVDKPDVRTVLHTGLPGSVEGYYQEIGRAGRDGLPSRAILLYSWADRRTHEYFHQRDYPEIEVVERVFAALPPPAAPGQGKDEILGRLAGLDVEVVDTALLRLWQHGGALLEPGGGGRDERFARGESTWRGPYRAQRGHRLAQLAEMTRCAETRQCRMLHLVRHFGDQEDSGEPCGVCDVCAPDSCAVRTFRRPTPGEEQVLRRALDLLRRRDGASTGQLFRSVGGGAGDGDSTLPRKDFERVLGGLARAGLVEVRDDAFEKDGRMIHFQRAALTAEGRAAGFAELAAVRIAEEPAPPAGGAAGGRRSRSKAKPKPELAALEAEADPALVEALKAWRLAEARSRKVPAYTILHDRTILALAASRPTDEDDLLAVRGIGPAVVTRYGAELLAILSATRPLIGPPHR